MRGTNQKTLIRYGFCKNPCCRISLHTMPREVKKKSDKSQLAARDSVESERTPAHTFIGTRVGHLPSAETNDAPVVTLFVDEKVFRRTKHLVDSLIAVFADVGHTFKRSKNFADHIFMG